MRLQRALPLGLGVTALLVLAGIASRGRPLSRSPAGSGPRASFFDYVYTTIVIVAVVALVITVLAFADTRLHRWREPPRRRHYLTSLLMLVAAALIAFYLQKTGFAKRLQNLEQRLPGQQPPGHRRVPPPGKDVRPARLRWDEIAIITALICATFVALYATRTRLRPRPELRRRRAHDALAGALDESLDDLRAEPDLRRAIIAAYARMECALSAGGVPRRPAEAPFEYLERALENLDASAGSVRRLTALFEWAKFSHHEPEPRMRDEAIAALVAVRDELRDPVEAAA
jgi:Domain of unknown function (DUF4129)